MKVAITGHRPHKLGNDYALTSPLLVTIKNTLSDFVDLNRHDITHLISGMALGIDTLWAELSLEKDIPLIAAVPCPTQADFWIDSSKRRYKKILANPLTTYHLVSDTYSPAAMQVRNQWMVDNCDLLIAVWDGSAGGTYNCIKYTEAKGLINEKRVLRIDPAEPDHISIMIKM